MMKNKFKLFFMIKFELKLRYSIKNKIAITNEKKIKNKIFWIIKAFLRI